MTDQITSKRYALALFNASESAGGGLTEQIQKELSFISDLWEKNQNSGPFLKPPDIGGRERKNASD